jgi:hypothetical protein
VSEEEKPVLPLEYETPERRKVMPIWLVALFSLGTGGLGFEVYIVTVVFFGSLHGPPSWPELAVVGPMALPYLLIPDRFVIPDEKFFWAGLIAMYATYTAVLIRHRRRRYALGVILSVHAASVIVAYFLMRHRF